METLKMNNSKWSLTSVTEFISTFVTELNVSSVYNAFNNRFEVSFSYKDLYSSIRIDFVIDLDFKKLVDNINEISCMENPNIPDFISNIDNYAEEIGKRFDEFKNYLGQFNGQENDYDKIARFFIKKGRGPVRGKMLGV